MPTKVTMGSTFPRSWAVITKFVPCPLSLLCLLMGTECQVLLGIAEASALAGWKEDHLSKGRLDVRHLWSEGRRIEATFFSLPMEVEPGPRFAYPQINARPGTPLSPKTAVATNGAIVTSPVVVNQSTPLALALFHATRVYLHTILSGSFPDIPVTATGVTQGIMCLNRVNTEDLDRSIVFTMCVLG